MSSEETNEYCFFLFDFMSLKYYFSTNNFELYTERSHCRWILDVRNVGKFQ